jgi:hypothetical protein
MHNRSMSSHATFYAVVFLCFSIVATILGFLALLFF